MREILRKKAGKVCRSFEPTAGKHFIFYYPRICVFKAYLRPLPRNEPIVRFLRQAPRRKLWKTKRRKLLAAAAELAFSWGNFIENATRNEAFASCRALLCARWPFFPPQSLRVLLFFRESVFARSCKDQDRSQFSFNYEYCAHVFHTEAKTYFFNEPRASFDEFKKYSYCQNSQFICKNKRKDM